MISNVKQPISRLGQLKLDMISLIILVKPKEGKKFLLVSKWFGEDCVLSELVTLLSLFYLENPLANPENLKFNEEL